VVSSSANAERTLFTVSIQNNRGPNLRIVNPLNGFTIDTIPITLSGFTVLGANGLARDPTTGTLWALLRVTGATQCQGGAGGAIPRLVTINPATGGATDVGNAVDCFSGLAFSTSGTLYGVTGDGGNTAETLFTFNKVTGVPAQAKVLQNGTDGEAIGFNPNDGLIYHASGNDTGGGTQIFESIDPGSLGTAPVNIPRSGFDYTEALGLTHSHVNTFLLTDGAGGLARLLTMTTSGVATDLGTMDHEAKGLAFAPKAPADFGADLKTDPGVYQASTGNWFFLESTTGFDQHLNFGGANFLPVPGDYDGDGETDTAVYDTVTGNWFIDQSTAGFRVHPSFGGPGFIPVPGDYDADGKTDVAVYQTSTGHWFIVGSTLGFMNHLAFGGSGFVPVPGDYDGDGQTDTAVYDTTTGNWFIAQSTAGFRVHPSFGGSGFILVQGDYDGDGKIDVGVYEDATGHWFFVGSTSGFGTHLAFGGSGFIPVPGDYDGDGETDTAVYEQSTGNWFISQSTAGFRTQPSFGGSGFVPVLPQVTILRALGLL